MMPNTATVQERANANMAEIAIAVAKRSPVVVAKNEAQRARNGFVPDNSGLHGKQRPADLPTRRGLTPSQCHL